MILSSIERHSRFKRTIVETDYWGPFKKAAIELSVTGEKW
jgi:hypothetical protein